MNAFAQYNIMEALPMPLTDVNQSGYDWFKFSHIEFLLNPRISSLKLVEQGALIRLMAHAARQVPFGSLPNDPQLLAAMTGLTLPRWNKIADAVLDAAFVQCNDDRWYCPLMIDELSPVQQDVEVKPAKAKKPVSPEISEARRQAGLKGKKAQMANLANDELCQNDDLAKSGKTLANDEFCQNDDLAKSGKTLANGGIKGGDLDQDSDLDLEVKQKHTSAEPSAARVSAFKTELSEVFEHWKFVFKKNAATKLNDKRKTKIVARLKDGYTVDQIKQAINGCAASEYHVQNHHTDIELICRDAVHTDRFIGMSPVTQKPIPSNPNPGAVNEKWPESKVTIPPTPETIAAIKKMQDELEC